MNNKFSNIYRNLNFLTNSITARLLATASTCLQTTLSKSVTTGITIKPSTIMMLNLPD